MSRKTASAPAAPDHGTDWEREVHRIQRTAEKQLAAVSGLNSSLVKKVRNTEAQIATLLSANKELEDKNADLVAQLERAHERADKLEKRVTELNASLVSAELALKKRDANEDSLESEYAIASEEQK